MCLCRQLLDYLLQPFRVLAPTLSAGELLLRKIEGPDRGSTIGLACSRRSDCRAGEKFTKRKKRGETRRGKGERTLAPLPPPPSACFPGVQLNSLPIYCRALLSERLEQATIGFYYAVIPTRIFSPSRNLDGYFWHPASRTYS